jgi:glycerol-3-phosphate acyltransferase PlsY
VKTFAKISAIFVNYPSEIFENENYFSQKFLRKQKFSFQPYQEVMTAAIKSRWTYVGHFFPIFITFASKGYNDTFTKRILTKLILTKLILYNTYTHAAYTHKTYTHAAYTVGILSLNVYSTERILNIYSRIFSLWRSIHYSFNPNPHGYGI